MNEKITEKRKRTGSKPAPFFSKKMFSSLKLSSSYHALFNSILELQQRRLRMQ
jgi:hypothetical protein